MSRARHANTAILPGSLLSYRSLYQQVADALPAGAILVVLPGTESRQRSALEICALHLQCAGYRVTTLVDETRCRRSGIQAPLPLGV